MNHLSIRRDGKSIQLTAEEMLEAYRRVREDLIEQDLLLRFSDSDVVDNLAKVLFLSNSEVGILEDILLVPGSTFLHGVSDSVAQKLSNDSSKILLLLNHQEQIYCLYNSVHLLPCRVLYDCLHDHLLYDRVQDS